MSDVVGERLGALIAAAPAGSSAAASLRLQLAELREAAARYAPVPVSGDQPAGQAATGAAAVRERAGLPAQDRPVSEAEAKAAERDSRLAVTAEEVAAYGLGAVLLAALIQLRNVPLGGATTVTPAQQAELVARGAYEL